MIERNLSSGESIYIFDDVFDASQIYDYEKYASKCLFQRIPVCYLGTNSRSNGEMFFGSVLSESDLSNFSIFNTVGFSKISSYFENMIVKRSWILCAEASTKYLYHHDEIPGGVTMLYYVNTFWHPEWGGETLFCNIKGEPEIAVACRPNRVVIFPSNLWHKPSGITRDAATRFSSTTTFLPK